MVSVLPKKFILSLTCGFVLTTHFRLAHLCTTNPETGTGHPVLGFNSEQLEECDIQERENQLQRIHLDSHKTTHLAILGTNNHLLFTEKVKYGRTLCMRHDHDGCIWIAKEDEDGDKWGLKHISTLPGFGYVEASKTNKKFCIAPPGSCILKSNLKFGILE